MSALTVQIEKKRVKSFLSRMLSIVFYLTFSYRHDICGGDYELFLFTVRF